MLLKRYSICWIDKFELIHFMYIFLLSVNLLQVRVQLAQIVETSQELCGSLSHCLNLFTQQEEVCSFRFIMSSQEGRVSTSFALPSAIISLYWYSGPKIISDHLCGINFIWAVLKVVFIARLSLYQGGL